MLAHRKQDGFTILELIIALTILAIVLTGIARLLITNQARSIEAKRTIVAIHYLQEYLERSRGVDYTNLALGTVNSTRQILYPATTVTVVETTASAGADGNLKQYTVTLTWRESSGRTKTITGSTYINRYGLNRQ